jgi:hypothetical protein
VALPIPLPAPVMNTFSPLTERSNLLKGIFSTPFLLRSPEAGSIFYNIDRCGLLGFPVNMALYTKVFIKRGWSFNSTPFEIDKPFIGS